jgi:hypothetical protein
VPPRRWLRLSALTAAVGVFAAGCTLLIDFDEIPALLEAGVDANVLGPPDVRVDSDVAVDAAEAGRDAGRDAFANPDACKGNKDGKYCGGDMIVWPAELKDDLVTCKGGVVANVRLCANGVGCIANLPGYPDECDECVKTGNGTFCGRDMPGWDALNVNQRVKCVSGREVGLLLCNTCKSNGDASACQ